MVTSKFFFGGAMDWNWFFSTLSQSAAATTGIFGAFIITKIFTNQTVFLEKKNRLKVLLAQAKKISSAAADCDITWYSDTVNKAAYKKIKKIAEDEIDWTDPVKIDDDALIFFKENQKFSMFTPQEEIDSEVRNILTAVCIANLKEFQRREEEARLKAEREKKQKEQLDKLVISPDALTLTDAVLLSNRNFAIPRIPLSLPTYKIPDITPHILLDSTLSEITRAYSDAKHHAALTTDFLDSIKGNPESPNLISYSLVFVIMIFIIGVIYPMSFMPVETGKGPELDFSISAISTVLFSFKGFLLTSVTFFFMVVMVIFAQANRSMKYSETDIKSLEKYTDVKGYSEYFVYFK